MRTSKSNILSANELLEKLNRQWATTKDIKEVGNIGLNKANEIRKDIQLMIERKGKRCPPYLVPMEYVVEYFGININYLKKISQKK